MHAPRTITADAAVASLAERDATAAALLEEALAGERFIAAGKVDARQAPAYRRKVALLQHAAQLLAAPVIAPAVAVAAEEDPYRAFLERKVPVSPQDGFEVDLADINPALKDFTRLIVQWALRGGRRALFLKFGLHKTVTQIELARLALKHDRGPALIVLPLGVRHEFFDDAERFFTGDCAVRLRFIRSHADFVDSQNVAAEGPPLIYLTNYEPVRDGKIFPEYFGFVSLDEAACLRDYGSKTFQTFLRLFAQVPLRFVATATPSPNRTKELIHYAGYLGVMDTGQALTRFFQRNSSKANDLTLYPHKEDEFWAFVHSWAIFLQHPSELGFSDEGYILPPLTVRWHEVPSDHAKAGPESDGQYVLLRMPAMGLQQAAAEKRDSMPARIAKMCEIIAADPHAHRILWHHLEAERDAIEAAVPGVRSIYGAQDRDANERNAVDFKHGRFKYLGTKPSMSGTGCNFQHHCHKAIFPGINFEFHDFIQPGRLACVHVKDRVLFGAVTGAGAPTISPFHAEAIFHFKTHGFDYAGMITIVTDVVRENNGTYRLGYSENAKDSTKMGVGSPEYVILMRKPQSDRSRGYADVPVTKQKPPLRAVTLEGEEGGEVTITVPVPGEGYSLARWQVDAHAFWRSSGNRLLRPQEFAAALKNLGMEQITRIFEQFSLAEIYDHEYVVALGEYLGDRLPKTFMALAPPSAHPAVWTDVNRMRTLNTAQASRRAQLHICPLQFDIVDRLITRYSNEGDLVYDPFGGLMTVPYRALQLGRRGQASELDPVSFKDGVHYLEAFEAGRALPSLFDVIDTPEFATEAGAAA